MISLEDLLGVRDVELLLGRLRPGKVGHDLQIRPHDLGLGGFAREALQTAELALDLLARLGGQLEGLDALSEVVRLLGVDVLTQFLLDRLHLLAQEDLALPFPQLLLHLLADLLLRLEQPDLLLQVDEERPQSRLDGEGLEEFLLLLHLEFCVEGDEIGQFSGRRHAAEQVVDDLLRYPPETADLGGALMYFLVERREGPLLRVERIHVVHLARDDLQVSVTLHVLERGGARVALNDHLYAARHLLHLGDAAHRADAVQLIGIGLLDSGVELGGGEEELVARDRLFDRLDRLVTAGGDRCRDGGEYDRAAERQNRQSQTLGDLRLGTAAGRLLRFERDDTLRRGGCVRSLAASVLFAHTRVVSISPRAPGGALHLPDLPDHRNMELQRRRPVPSEGGSRLQMHVLDPPEPEIPPPALPVWRIRSAGRLPKRHPRVKAAGSGAACGVATRHAPSCCP